MRHINKSERAHRKSRNKGCIPLLLTVIPALAAIVIAVGVWVGMSYMEAGAYNRATGSNVSTWDAMWISLRVTNYPTP